MYQTIQPTVKGNAESDYLTKEALNILHQCKQYVQKTYFFSRTGNSFHEMQSLNLFS